jgi:acyl-CoA reductase-like NAD-dependent aldehyde dehydrogenase
MSLDISARNPRTGVRDYTVTATCPEKVADMALKARSAQPGWVGLGLSGRLAVLNQFSQALVAHRGPIVSALEADTGRRRIAGLELDSVIGALAGWGLTAPNMLSEDWLPARTNLAIRHRAQWVPYGLVAVISPWNFPLLLGMIDTVPALLAGCTVMVKPSEVTPRFISALKAAIETVPALNNVLQILIGDGAVGAALIDQVDCVCFTGSVNTGRKVAIQAASRLIPAYLELGGKDALIVLEGANLEAASDAALRGSVLSTGQACQSIERIYVQNSVLEPFLALLTAKAKAVGRNWPAIDHGHIGPIIFERQAQILADQIADAVLKGAEIRTGGVIETDGGGLWLDPTILTNVTHAMTVMTEETFGPIMPVMAFDTPSQAVELANFGEFGLSAAVFAASLEQAEALGMQLEAGAISLNDAALTATFYEAAKQSFKASGLGPSRMGAEGFARFFRRKALIANTGAPSPLSAFAEEG